MEEMQILNIVKEEEYKRQYKLDPIVAQDPSIPFQNPNVPQYYPCYVNQMYPTAAAASPSIYPAYITGPIGHIGPSGPGVGSGVPFLGTYPTITKDPTTAITTSTSTNPSTSSTTITTNAPISISINPTDQSSTSSNVPVVNNPDDDDEEERQRYLPSPPVRSRSSSPAPPAPPAPKTLSDILEILAKRITWNISNRKEMNNLNHVCTQIQSIHWDYLDHYCAQDSSLPRLKFPVFMKKICTYIPSLHLITDVVDDVIRKWRGHCRLLARGGAIFLDYHMEQVLLVQDHGGNWSFPKGKKECGDDDLMECAIREVLEETSYNCNRKIRKDCYIEESIKSTTYRMYIITDVRTDFVFKCKTQNEIADFCWFKISYLKGQFDSSPPSRHGRLATVYPFMQSLIDWIEKNYDDS